MPSHVELSDDQRALVETTREFCEQELLPLDRRCDRDGSSITQILPKIAELGLLELLVPESLGGLGCSYPTYVSILHEVSKSSPSTAVTLSVHSLAGSILDKRAAEPKRTEWLSSWGSAENFGAFALSEAGAGSDAANIKTMATKVDGGFRLTGEKMWITNGLTGRWFLTLARLVGAPEKESLLALLVDGNEPGVERTEIPGKMGIRASETAVINYTDVFVPSDHLIGELGRGLEVFLSGLDRGRLGIAAQASGIAEACLCEMVSYARQREQFGKPIGSFQAVANMIADSAVELEAARSLIWRGALAVEAGEPHSSASSMAKLYASEAANRIAYRAVQIHGGAGYVNECRVEQLYRDARVTTIYEGTSEIQRIVIARELGGR
ncbi:MAG: acyl-CoA dehydrogenase family protein [Planctomycetes bacterium]|nr:acyl-CoA dehydrogenase family protein [Planctomycetota bacterium]